MSKRLQGSAVGYAVFLGLIMAAALLGWIPGTDEVGSSGPLAEHPYRLSMMFVTIILAVGIGAWSALYGLEKDRLFLGLGILIGGGIATGVILSFAPYILYPNDQYPVSFMWTIGGGPIGFAVWLAVSFGRKVMRGGALVAS